MSSVQMRKGPPELLDRGGRARGFWRRPGPLAAALSLLLGGSWGSLGPAAAPCHQGPRRDMCTPS